ncbi:PTS IIA-like nitrogen regulatory protein PtsN [Aureimonas ureilytica]|uniref:PTS IIA-like nitrogen regulatory protein PtsN n=1 Tax=Aureimonas ureilytica TaxID=401562 RepID=UPI000380DAC4|nr:PTS IIA-like nitrogen regulatory protein PtsN [Aureimonas ureilytica]
MDLADLIAEDAILPALRSQSKKQVLQDISEKASELTGLPARTIFETILQRERLGSTGIGNGIAIPHGKLNGLPGIRGVFARLVKPVEFEAMDDQPVDLVFLLVAPETAGADHLKALSKIARMLRNPQTVTDLRAGRDAHALHHVMTQSQPTP